jgi:hypothetical protein
VNENRAFSRREVSTRGGVLHEVFDRPGPCLPDLDMYGDVDAAKRMFEADQRVLTIDRPKRRRLGG